MRVQACEPRERVHAAGEVGYEHGRGPAQGALELGDGPPVALGESPRLVEVASRLGAQVLPEERLELRAGDAPVEVARQGVDAVHDRAREREPPLVQAAGEGTR